MPKYEEQLELKISKAQLEELKKEALEAMETQKKRYVVQGFFFPFANQWKKTEYKVLEYTFNN